MAEVKLDLLDDLFSSKLSDHSWNPESKVISDDASVFHSKPIEGQRPHGLQDESKGIADQSALENSMPLSPQWLYTKPPDVKDARAAASLPLGNYNSSSQNDGWQLDGSKGKKDLISVSSGIECNRRWHEEERETGLFGAKRDHRKADCRADGPAKESTNVRSAPQSVQRQESSNRTSGQETRRDSKWSSRWGPNEKVREARTEKKVDVGRERDGLGDVQLPSTVSRSACDRESDSHDRWRPRHRIDVHSAGSTSTLLRTPPGSCHERGQVEGANSGFAFGRGRSSPVGRSSSGGAAVSDHPHKTVSCIGGPNVRETFCYPRGKLLDIYRFHMDDPCFAAMPDEMAEFLPISERCVVKPCAFVPPNAKEQVILLGISNGKITNSEVGPKSHFLMEKRRQSENTSDADSYEFTKEKLSLSPVLCGDAATIRESASVVELQNNDFCSSPSGSSSMSDVGDRQDDVDGREKLSSEGLASLEFDTHTSFSATPDPKAILSSDSSSRFISLPTQKSQDTAILDVSPNGVRFEDLYMFYVDPHGMIQGPFLGSDVVLWLEEGYFGKDLPVLLADAPEGTPFRALGEVMRHLKLCQGCPVGQMGEYGGELQHGLPFSSSVSQVDSSTLDDIFQPLMDLNLSAHHPHWGTAAPEAPLKPHVPGGHGFHDSVTQEEEIVFPGRTGTVSDPLQQSTDLYPFSNQPLEPILSYSNDIKCHPFGLSWSELEGSHAKHDEASHNKLVDNARMDSFVSRNDPPPSFRSSNMFGKDMAHEERSMVNPMAVGHLAATEQNHSDNGLLSRFGSQQFQRQQHFDEQRNELPYQAYLSDSLLDHALTHNFLRPHVQDTVQLHEHLHLQEQQLQIQLLQQQRVLQQKLHQQQQELLQEHNQSQIRHALFNQLMQEQNLSYNRTATDMLDLFLTEQKLLHSRSASMATPSEYFALQQGELQELLSRQNHGQAKHPLLQQQQQLQVQQLLRELRQQQRTADDSLWLGNDADKHHNCLAGDQRGLSSWIGSAGCLELNQNLFCTDHPKERCYKNGPMLPFEQSSPLSVGASNVNMGAGRVASGSHGLDLRTPGFPTHSPQSMFSDQPSFSPLDTMAYGWSRGNQLLNTQMGADPRLWASKKFDDHTSKQLLMELLHQESGGHSSLSMPVSSAMSRCVNGMPVYDFSFEPTTVGLPLGVVSREEANQDVDLIDSQRYATRGHEDVFSGSELVQNFDGRAVSWGTSECLSSTKGLSSFEILDHHGVGQARLDDADFNEPPVDAFSRHSSSAGVAGFNEDGCGLPDSCAGLDTKNQVVVSINGQDIVLARRPPTSCASASQEELSGLRSGAAIEERSHSWAPPPAGTNQMSHGSSSATNKEMFLGRSCFSDADQQQPSFLDIVKNNARKACKSEAATTPCLSEQLTRSGKKKGKKGKQIDPALLGFRVMSNRIMMGEIQRLED